MRPDDCRFCEVDKERWQLQNSGNELQALHLPLKSGVRRGLLAAIAQRAEAV